VMTATRSCSKLWDAISVSSSCACVGFVFA
jgi:hypothetical protein